MLGWGLWVSRSPVFSPRKWEVFSYHNKGYNTDFFFRRYWDVNFRHKFVTITTGLSHWIFPDECL